MININLDMLFDSIEDKKESQIKPNKLVSAYEEIVSSFIEQRIPNLSKISLEQLDLFLDEFDNISITKHSNGRITVSGKDTPLQNLFSSLILLDGLETCEEEADDNEIIFI
ncbi:hypothetical protein CN931_24010 [Bacillus sp. AFS054943]|uniref:Uncharacterized protein n=2 Tax=Bacillus cereus TaxID=1396 RepID=A0A2C1LN26_BACCE|nr:hypothetical protein [Bacillus sp. AFS054943]PGL78080.1 hypothetical protein CN931_24010 [Bacillus sp. AFS054943]PGT99866.1 hypothetical protein COD19_18210 [Bacillus cereus]